GSALASGSGKLTLWSTAGLTKVSSALVLVGLGVGAWTMAQREVPEPATPVSVIPAPTLINPHPATPEPPQALTAPVAEQPVSDSVTTPAPPSALPDAPPLSTSVRSAPAYAPPSELELLRQAQRVLTRDPAKALKLCRKHAQLHPRGQLAQEREALVIEALRRLNRGDEATRRQKKFESQYPDSALKRRVSDKPLPSSSQ